MKRILLTVMLFLTTSYALAEDSAIITVPLNQPPSAKTLPNQYDPNALHNTVVYPYIPKVYDNTPNQILNEPNMQDQNNFPAPERTPVTPIF